MSGLYFFKYINPLLDATSQMLIIVLLHCLLLFFIHLKLQMLTQFLS